MRFEREARTAARVSDHANVVTIYDVGEHEGNAFIVMECFTGGTVAEQLRGDAPVPREQALGWLEDAAAALDAAHAEGIVHRDVKPANLLLDERGRLAVGDFGIARLATDVALTSTGQVLGTAAYLSPEQALGEPATSASDRYALAVVAYELLTGRRPFAGEHAAAQARQHVEAPAAARDGGRARPPARGRPRARSRPGQGPRRSLAVRDRFRERAARRPGRPRARHGGRACHGADSSVQASRGHPPATAGSDSDRAFPSGPACWWRWQSGASSWHWSSRPAATERRGVTDRTAPAKTTTTARARSTPSSTASEAATLNAQGKALLDRGSYAQAIDVLNRAVQAGRSTSCANPPSRACLDNFAYPLFNLAQAYRLSGQPAQAIPLLQERLQIADQTAVVQQELEAAQQALANPGKAKGKAKKPKKG